MKASTAIRVLHYLVPTVTLAYFYSARIIATCFLHKPTKKAGIIPRRYSAISLLAGAITALVAQAVTYFVQSLAHHGLWATQDSVVYTLASTFAYGTLVLAILENRTPVWHPFLGATLVAFALELPITVLYALFRSRDDFAFSRLALQLVKSLLLLCFCLSQAWYALHDRPLNQDDLAETEPLLPSTTNGNAHKPDYGAVVQDEDDYDDGSYGPVVLRLGWHASGTYDAATGTGGSNGATMRFAPEKEHGANSGLKAARDFLEPIKEQFPWITYSDLWTLAAVCAVQEMGGPTIPWRSGRNDRDVAYCTPDGRLPDGSKSQNHLRAIFGRMGFSDQEIVALSGAHALGRCHSDRSGFEGPWTFSPITMTNDFYKLLLDEKWHERDWKGPRQFQDDSSRSLMMLPTDMALVEDEGFKTFVEKYAENQDVFFDDFSQVVTKLLELGVPFTTSEEARIEFKRTG